MDKKKILMIAGIVIAIIGIVIAVGATQMKTAQKKAEIQQAETQAFDDAWEALDLVWDKNAAKLRDTATEELMQDAQIKIAACPDSEEKDELIEEYNKAESALSAIIKTNKENEEKAKILVDALWDNTNQTTKNNAGRKELEEARAAVELVADKAVKEELKANVEKADAYITGKEEDAKEAVGKMWDFEGQQMYEEAVEEDLRPAKDIVTVLPEGEVKDELTKIVERIQNEFNTRKELEVMTVFQVFWDFDAETLYDGAEKSQFDEAKKLVETLPKGETKTKIEEAVPKIEQAFKDRIDAEKAEQVKQEQEAQEAADEKASQEQEIQTAEKTENSVDNAVQIENNTGTTQESGGDVVDIG